ncbi:D-aminoacylase [Aureibaculum sp. 2210JD6-5]|uniref:N-acyl-D-amino-acid deacylase family protein n=1 Tax=Aureibaculum sp. 2210JD6-5 TaxID=3103957 RepID=UPI002AADBE2A|nr:D-aminoacylase [Aureibaculum sp. 2210JD6-5]MDY7396124.1 D-aminoacylase [Aureibaculum sp. 2210JD6-5]
MKMLKIGSILISVLLITSCAKEPDFDILIKNGKIVDGSGESAFTGDVGINADTIDFIGNSENKTAKQEIDATGLVVSPGFINMLSWAASALNKDGRSIGDIKQGVTLEVFGEGSSIGPQKKIDTVNNTIEWISLNEKLQAMVIKGVSPNIASFIGATTLRINTVGYEDRPPTAIELDSMKMMVEQAMEEGAMGIGSSLIYAPAFYSSTEELIEISKVAAEYDGLYISHIRSEGNKLLESIDELLRIAKEANIRAEIYHLKMSGKDNWHKFDDVVAKIDSARKSGLTITTNMYSYIAGSTGLDASMPPWVQEGGYDKWAERLQDPKIRKKVLEDMRKPAIEWESLMQAAGSADKMILVGFDNDSLRYLTGKTLAEVAKMRNTTPEETAMDLVVQNGSDVSTVYFMMSEENVKKQIALPWMSFGSDAGSYATEGDFLKYSTHPRAYGNFARVIGKYTRDEKLISLEEAIRKLTSLPASNLKIKKRGSLKAGNYADIAIFDYDKVQDHATFEKPHQYATGMVHVFVNGTHVLKDGEHTGKKPGRVVKGPGYVK